MVNWNIIFQHFHFAYCHRYREDFFPIGVNSFLSEKTPFGVELHHPVKSRKYGDILICLKLPGGVFGILLTFPYSFCFSGSW